jgi:predicted RNase H-like nuclease (RuvC/YqgF family)
MTSAENLKQALAKWDVDNKYSVLTDKLISENVYMDEQCNSLKREMYDTARTLNEVRQFESKINNLRRKIEYNRLQFIKITDTRISLL